MSAHALARPFPRTLLVALASALAGGLAILALTGLVRLGDGSAPSPVYKTKDFSITVPRGWTTHGGATTVLRKGDGRATVVVRRTGKLHGSLRTIARDLTARLSARVPGFRLVGARVGHVRAGAAFVYTFVRSGAAQSLTIANVRGATYRIDTVVRAGSPDAAREAGAAVGSFGP
ncbi:MAG: hypothetical protein QOI19_2439 [Thermoleophilaceae bacterium]|nr:hypothetical protein [Thermoleophilaceae bacterium]